jgi:hypothetical protein
MQNLPELRENCKRYGEPARFRCEGNLPKITIVIQNLPELRENCERYGEPAKQIHLILRGTCQTSRMIRIVIFGSLSKVH